MWKLFFVYSDKSKCTITGKGPEITLQQAIDYQKQYGVRAAKSTYQKYPKAKNDPETLDELIEKLEEEALN
jgi:hypothetical protein